VVGAIAGGVLLLTTPAHAFNRVVPVLIVVACVMLLLQRRIAETLVGRHGGRSWLLRVGMLGTAVYGGYFGAAVSVLVLALLAVTVEDTLPRLNALKVPLAGVMNLVAGIVFVFAGHVAWAPAALIAVGSLVGGVLGAHTSRRLSPRVLRGVIVVVGIAAMVHLLA